MLAGLEIHLTVQAGLEVTNPLASATRTAGIKSLHHQARYKIVSPLDNTTLLFGMATFLYGENALTFKNIILRKIMIKFVIYF